MLLKQLNRKNASKIFLCGNFRINQIIDQSRHRRAAAIEKVGNQASMTFASGIE